MKSYSIFAQKRVKQIPKGLLLTLGALGLVVLCCLVQILFPASARLEDLDVCQIQIDHIRLVDSHNTKGDRLKLELMDGEQTFYLWYSQSSYSRFAGSVEGELLTGAVTAVTAKLASHASLRDVIGNRKRIVDLRSDASVYYDLETEIENIRETSVGTWLLLLLLTLALVCGVLYTMLVYRVMA